MEQFTSQIIRGGYWLTPYHIIVDETHIRFSKRTKWLINVQESSIPLNKVSKIDIKPSIIGTDIIIDGFGGNIHAKNFSIENAKRIKQIIEKYQDEHKNE